MTDWGGAGGASFCVMSVTGVRQRLGVCLVRD